MNEELNQSLPAVETNSNPGLPPLYFPVSPLKLLVLSTCTLGIYELYWFYKNWRLLQERERSDIMPVGRAIFAHFFCYSLFKRVELTAEVQRVQKTIAAGPLAAGWIILTLLARLPDPYWLVSFGAVFFLLPVQSAVNEINLVVSPQHNPNRNFTGWNIVAVVIGGLFLILVVAGTFITSQ